MSRSRRFSTTMTWLFVGVCVVLLVCTFVQSEIYHQGETTQRDLKYYVISIFGICFWLAVSRFRDETKIGVVVAALSLVTSLLVAEISLGILEGHHDDDEVLAARVEAAEAAGRTFDTRSKYQVWRDLRSEGFDAVLSVHPSFFISSNGLKGSRPLFPLGGVSKKTTVFCNESGKRTVYLSDRFGFNNPDWEWEQPRTDWVITGDSYAQGACVDPGQDVAGWVRSLTGESVINLGSGGNGPLVELAVLGEYAASRKPRIVLWLYCEVNDLNDLAGEETSPLLMSYLESGFSQHLVDRQAEIDDSELAYIRKRESEETKKPGRKDLRGYVSRTIRLSRIRTLLNGGESDPDIDPLFGRVLQEARNRVAAWGGQLLFVYLPDYERYLDRPQDRQRIGRRLLVNSAVLDLVAKLDIPVIDIHKDVFEKHPDWRSLFPLRMGGHYNAEGYRLVAEAVVSRARALPECPR